MSLIRNSSDFQELNVNLIEFKLLLASNLLTNLILVTESSLIIIEGGRNLIEKILLASLSKITYVRSLVNYHSISEVVALLTTR